MTPWFSFVAVAVALVLPGQSATALTPEEAWAAVQAISVNAGQTITAESTTQSDDALTVTGVDVTVTTAEGPLMSAHTDSIVFRDLGDGTVQITYAPDYTATFTLPDAPAGTAKSFQLAIATDQIKTIASGSVEAPVFKFTAEKAAAALRNVVRDDGQPMDLSVTVDLAGLSGTYTTQAGQDAPMMDTDIAVKSLNVVIAQSDALGSVNGTVSVSDLAAIGKQSAMSALALQSGDLSALLAAGFILDSRMTTGSVTMALGVENYGTPGQINGTLAGTSLNMQLDKTRLDYGISLTGGQFTGNGFDIPFPEIASAFGEMSFGLVIPVQPSKDPQDFSFLVKLVDLTLTEDLWAFFDPGQRLPRDPVTLIVDLDGKAAWTRRLFDRGPMTPEEAAEDMVDYPGKLYALDLTEVLLRAVGAQVAAKGGLTFDNTKTQEFGGIPDPEGTITVTLDGINAVLDALVTIGLVSQDDMMGARMALAMFFRPGAKPDQLVTDMEFRDGGLFVNGQQVF